MTMPRSSSKNNWDFVSLSPCRKSVVDIWHSRDDVLTVRPPTPLQVADLDGLAHYKALGIKKSANAEAIKKVRLASQMHAGMLQVTESHLCPNDERQSSECCTS